MVIHLFLSLLGFLLLAAMRSTKVEYSRTIRITSYINKAAPAAPFPSPCPRLTAWKSLVSGWDMDTH